MEGYPNQMAAALAFINAHPGQIGFITISIGGNDTAGRTGTNVPAITAQLRAAAGPNVKIAGQNYQDPVLANWLKGPTGQQQAQASQATFHANNDWLDSKFMLGGATVSADIGTSFGTYYSWSGLQDYNGQLVPAPVARLCTYTHNCDATSPNPRLTDAGKMQAANEIGWKLNVIPPN